MKPVFFLLLTMSLTGTLPFLAYLAVQAVLAQHFSASFRYVCLKLVLTLFLLPFPLLKHLAVLLLFPETGPRELNHYYYLTDTLIVTYDGLHFRLEEQSKIFLGIWIGILLFLLIWQIVRFLRFRQIIADSLKEDQKHQAMLLALKKEAGLRKTIRLYHCAAPVSPFTYGFFRPVILLTGNVPESSVELILRHELQHIKSEDFFIRALTLIAIFLHFFNPIIYVFLREFEEVQELHCDEKVTRTLSDFQKKAYGHLLVDMAAGLSERKKQPVLHFSKDNRSFLKKRILNITRPVPLCPAAMVILMTLMLTFSAIPVCAYSPATLDWREDPYTTRESLRDVDWQIYLENSDLSETLPEDEQYFQYANTYFLSEDGTVILDSLSPYTRAACQHTFKNGQIKKHSKKGRGCTVKTYQASYCSKCKYVKTSEFLSETTYATCPHK